MEKPLARVSVPGLSKKCRPGTERGRRERSGRGECSKSAETPQTWNGEEAAENAPAGVSVPSLSKRCRPGTRRGRRECSAGECVPSLLKLRKPGTATGHREASGEGECSKSAETPQTGNGNRTGL